MDFEAALHDLGFSLSRRGRSGITYSRRSTPHLTYYVLDAEDGTLIFSWEFAVAEWAAGLGLQIGSDEHLNIFLYPKQDARGERDAGWVSQQMDLVEERLRGISFLEE